VRACACVCVRACVCVCVLTSHMNSTHVGTQTYDWVMSHIRKNNVTHVNKSWHTHAHVKSCVAHIDESSCLYAWIMSHIWMRRVARIYGADTLRWVVSHIWMSRVTHLKRSCDTHLNESYHTSGGVVSNIWMVMSIMCKRHITHLNETCHASESVMSHI